MHRFPNLSSVSRFRFAALLFVIRSLLPVVGLPMMFWSMMIDDREWFWMAVWVLAAFPVVAIAQWIAAARVRCPLCMVQPLVSRGCAKNRKANRLFGSYRLRVACCALLFGNFRCQYCGEPTEMKVRARNIGADS